MTGEWSLPDLLESLNSEVEEDLKRARKTINHPGDMGDASESVWIDLFNKYLPTRYETRKAHVVDSKGEFSDQLDVVIHDRQYSPFVFTFQNKFIVPAESIYAVFEAKQDMTAGHIAYAQNKVASVRRLHVTSLPVPTITGMKPAKAPHHILGGFLSLACDWKRPFDDTMRGHLNNELAEGRLDMGCVAEAGLFTFADEAGYTLSQVDKPVTAFLLELIARLQEIATVPMIDVRAYAVWLGRESAE